MNKLTLFGVRHLSPGGAWHLRRLLEEKRPRLVLIEGPADFTALLPDLVRSETQPPVAVLAYTKNPPIHTLLFPLAAYSPEYQAALWASKNSAECRFIDLPSEVFLGLPKKGESAKDGEEERFDVYGALDRISGGDGHETFWERTFEHSLEAGDYHEGANLFGKELRSITAGKESDWAENLVREAHMSREINRAFKEGYSPEEIVVVTGSYHVEGLREAVPMSDEEFALLPREESERTLMPYSYYRLSSRSGYGAGNKAPAYYELLWNSLCRGEVQETSYLYLSKAARWQREHGFPVSSAEIIEGVSLARALAAMRGFYIPALRDLRDAAVTCLGHGSLLEIRSALAHTEVGTAIGNLPEGVSRTSIQEDFYRLLREFKLEKYRGLTAQELALDLRANRTVKSEKAAFLDLERSFFLHRLRVIGVSFAQQQAVNQEGATWSEHWILRWTPESEIELVESALKGDTIILAASFQMKERVEKALDMSAIAAVIEDAFNCGMPSAVSYAAAALQSMSVEAASMEDLALTAQRLSAAIQYGSIRKLDSSPLEPILQQLYLRSSLLLQGSCVCDDGGAEGIVKAMNAINAVELAQEFLESAPWLTALKAVAQRDDLNTRCSGFAAAILLERGQMSQEELSLEVQRRLSRGVPADLGAGWFEGLALKNRYALIGRLFLWESLDEYLNTLDDEEFKRALVFLRRAFADFSSREKSDIAENLGEIWNLDPQDVSRVINTPLPVETAETLAQSVEDFDFDDI